MKLPELEELYRRYRMDLYRYLCFLTHDPVQAEDLLSETFVRVIKRLPTFRGECEVKTWLFGIARNIWLESLRRRHLAAKSCAACRPCCSKRTSAPAAWYICGRRGIRTRRLPKNCK